MYEEYELGEFVEDFVDALFDPKVRAELFETLKSLNAGEFTYSKRVKTEETLMKAMQEVL